MVVWSLQLCHWCFFYRLVFDGAVIFRIVLLLLHTSSPFFGGPTIRVALLQNWDVLPWLLRQRDCWWTSLVLFWEDHAFSCKHCRLITSTLSLMFFYWLLIDEALVSRLVLHLLDNSSHFSWAIVCSAAPELSFSTLVTKTERYWCWTDWVFFWESHAFSYKHGCLILWTLSLMFFLQVSIWRSCYLPDRFASPSHIVAFFWGANNTCSSAPKLRCSTVVTETERYWCWTDWVFFWESHAFSYKHGCLIRSTLSLMFFYRLVFKGAVVFQVVLLLVDTS